MFGHVSQTVDRYLELSGKERSSLNTKVATPSIDDHLIPPEEFEVKGALSPIAARVVLKALLRCTHRAIRYHVGCEYVGPRGYSLDSSVRPKITSAHQLHASDH